MPTIKQNDDGSIGLPGKDLGNGGFVHVSMPWSAASVDGSYFVADRAYRVTGIRARITAAGTDGGAVTARPFKAPSGTAIASGTALSAATFDLKTAANTNATVAVSTTSSALDIDAGDAIGLDFTGTMTTATGVCTVTLAPR